MRKIEFRGFDYENGVWRYGSLIQYPNGECVIVEFITEKEELSYDVDPETVGQFTELKDKTGTEIYEGDIVKHRGYNGMKNSVVTFEAGAFIVGYHDGSSTKRRPMLLYDKVEVIGNIHDNKDLLK